MKKRKGKLFGPINWPLLLILGLAAFVVCVLLFITILGLVGRYQNLQIGGGLGFAIPQKQTASGVVFNPEISVNEYWDFGTLNGLRLYVNNTDRNVIYALDDSGKIIWTIWGKDYGINGYQIKMRSNHLFIYNPAKDEDLDVLRVFDGNGQLAWQHTFYGYLDMEQIEIIDDRKVILENRTSQDKCNQGSGILSKNQTLDAYCTTHELWAFDINTGDVLWVNNTNRYLGVYMDIMDDGNIKAQGGGWGHFHYYYTLDSNTGEVLTFEAEYGGLVYNENKQTVSYIPGYKWYDPEAVAPQWIWTKNSDLFDTVKDNLFNTKLGAKKIGDMLLLQEAQEDGSVLTNAIDEQGKIIWSRVIDQDGMYFSDAYQGDGIIFFKLTFTSQCGKVCSQCSGFICADYSDAPDCVKCHEQEVKAPDYTVNRILAINPKNGAIMWRYDGGSKAMHVERADNANQRLIFYTYPTNDQNDMVHKALDYKTGREVEGFEYKPTLAP